MSSFKRNPSEHGGDWICEKCNGVTENLSMVYCDGEKCSKGFSVEEHLHVKCWICGYIECQPCKDSK